MVTRYAAINTEMSHVVQGFVTQITELARRAAIGTHESAFGAFGRAGHVGCANGAPAGAGCWAGC